MWISFHIYMCWLCLKTCLWLALFYIQPWYSCTSNILKKLLKEWGNRSTNWRTAFFLLVLLINKLSLINLRKKLQRVIYFILLNPTLIFPILFGFSGIKLNYLIHHSHKNNFMICCVIQFFISMRDIRLFNLNFLCRLIRSYRIRARRSKA